MRLELTGRHLTITAPTRRAVEAHLEHTLRMLKGSAVSAHVVLARDGSRFRVEVTLHAGRERFLHGAATGPELQATLAAAAQKIDRQAQKLKGKWREEKRRGPSAVKAVGAATVGRQAGVKSPAKARASKATQRRIIRVRRSALTSMSIEDAATAIPDTPSAVLVFRHAVTDAITVLIRRADGHLSLVEPDA